jgi:aspartate carbamoyltransferase catalytic subunit
MRHPKEGAPLVAANNASIPVINAGDGGHNHPTQTLADLLTIWREKGRFDDLTVGFCGDLKFGRTVHSLISALSRYKGIKVILISPEELKLPSYIKKDVLNANSIEYVETTDLSNAMPELDILYMTRVQRERFVSEEEYMRLKDSYILTPDKLTEAKKDLSVLHPLPRVNEISVAVDNDPRACYFKQVLNGKYMRMALILKLLSSVGERNTCSDQENDRLVNEIKCKNPRCITSTEQELDHIFKLTDREKQVYRCIYCETKAE